MIRTAIASPRRALLVFLGVVISIVAAVLAVRGVDLDRTMSVIRTADARWLVVALAVIALQTVARSARWRLLLPVGAGKWIGIRRIIPVLLVGYLGNAVLPARLGEAMRGIILARRESLPTAETLGSVVLERILDTLVLAILGVAAALAIGVPDWVVQIGGLGVVLSIMAIGIVALTPRLLARVRVERIRRIVEATARVVHGARISRPPRRIAGALGLCVVAWLLDATVYWLAARSIGLEIAPVGAVLISAVTVLATAVPSAPAYVGTFELAVVAVAGVLGVDPSAALAYALIVHGIAILPITLAGVVALAAIGRDARSARIVSAPVLGR